MNRNSLLKTLYKSFLLFVLFVAPLFGNWEVKQDTTNNIGWYYARSEIITPYDNTVPDLLIRSRVVVACRNGLYYAYMVFDNPLKLISPIKLVDRELHDVKVQFDDMLEQSTGTLYKNKSDILEFADDEGWVRSFFDFNEFKITLPWRNKHTVSFLVSLDGAAESINDIFTTCDIVLEEKN